MKEATNGDFSVFRKLGCKLSRARNAVISDLNRGLTPLGINAAEASALLAIRDTAVTTASALSNQLDLDSGFISRLLDRLEKRSLITRVRKTEDRRVVQVMLTTSGKEKLDCGIERSMLDWGKRLSNLTDEEWLELVRLLDKLTCGFKTARRP